VASSGVISQNLRRTLNNAINVNSPLTHLNIAGRRTNPRKPCVVTFALILLLALTLRCPAAEKSLENEFLLQSWDTEDGLPSSRAQGVGCTPDGYLWIATWNGLSRFDGTRFVTFNTKNTPELGDDRITCLLVDREGTLWVGTRGGGLARQQSNGFTAVNLRKSAPRVSWIRSFAEDTEGALWVAADGAGVIRLQRNGDSDVFGASSGLPSDPVYQLVCDTNDHMWALAGGKLFEFAQGRWQPPDGVPPQAGPVRAIAAGRDGGLWVGMLGTNQVENRGGRILKLKDRLWVDEQEPYPWNQDSLLSRVDFLLEDRSGRLWCATNGAGVFYRNPGQSWQPLDKAGVLSQILSGTLGYDRDGSVWFGTKDVGFFGIRPRTVTTLTPPPDAVQNTFLSACVTQDGSVWGGMEDSGAVRWRDGVMTRYGPEQGLTNSHIAVLFEDREAHLWAGTWGGLFRFDGQRFQPVPGPPALSKVVLALTEDREGTLWVGTGGGLVRMHGSETRVFGEPEGVPSSPIRAVEQDHEGQIWLAVTGNGLFRQVGERFEHYAAGQWAGEKMIRSLYADADGALWIITEGTGLFRLKDGHFTQYTSQDGLPSDHLQFVLGDRAGNLWFGSENGVFGCPRQTLDQYQRGSSPRLYCWRLARADGLASKVCSGAGQPTATLSPDGRLWFPNGDALAVFDPNHLPQRAEIRAPVVEETLVDGVNQTPDLDGRVRVMSSMRRLELHFTSPNTTSPEHLRFQIWMKGLDTDWVNVNETHVTSYSHLAPGPYKFQVEAAGPDGKWIESPHPLEIEIVPTFYERRSVQIGGALALLAAVAAAVWRAEQLRTRRRLERMEAHRAMDQERQRIARDIHDDLGSGLTEIIMVSDHLREDMAQTPAGGERIRDISDRARALTRAMDEVVWAVNPHDDTLESLITYLNDFAQEHLALAGVRYRLDAPLELPELSLSAETRHSLYLASKEALNNAAKHSGASEIWMRLQLNGSSFTLSIEDNGKGFDLSKHQDRGHGLQNMRKRLEDVGGHCEVRRLPDSGMQVKFLLTMRRTINQR
jgi:ligand-binding sensor domain-containing protein/signal transduction histidine kinase